MTLVVTMDAVREAVQNISAENPVDLSFFLSRLEQQAFKLEDQAHPPPPPSAASQTPPIIGAKSMVNGNGEPGSTLIKLDAQRRFELLKRECMEKHSQEDASKPLPPYKSRFSVPSNLSPDERARLRWFKEHANDSREGTVNTLPYECKFNQRSPLTPEQKEEHRRILELTREAFGNKFPIPPKWLFDTSPPRDAHAQTCSQENKKQDH